MNIRLPETPSEPSGFAEFSLLLKQTGWMKIVTLHNPRVFYYRIVKDVVDWCSNNLRYEVSFRWLSMIEHLSSPYGNRFTDAKDAELTLYSYFLVSFPTLCFEDSGDMVMFALNFPEYVMCETSLIPTKTFIELNSNRVAYRSDPYPLNLKPLLYE